MWTLLLVLALAGGQQPGSSHAAGLKFYAGHQWADAAREFTAAVAVEKPDTPEYRESVLLLGQSLYLSAKYEAAIPWLEQASAGGQGSLEAAFMLGNARILTQKEDQAVEAFARLFGVSTNSAAAHVSTAQMMLHLDAEAAAMRQARKALEIDPRVPQAHFILGEAAIFHADIDLAVTELKREIEINPGFAMAYYRLGDAYTRREMWDQAIPQLQRSIWLNPYFSGPYILLGKSYLKRKDLSNADAILRHAVDLDPKNLSAHYLLAQTLMQEGKTEDAKKALARWEELKNKAQ